MTRIRYTEEQTLAAVGPLTRTRLTRLIETDCVSPDREGTAAVFTEADVARLHLLCELADDLELGEEALPVVMSLLDQLHGLRREMRRMLRAIDAEAEEVRLRLRRALQEIEEG